MQGVIPKFSAYNHDIRSTGGAKGRDNREIFEEKLGLGTDEIALLKEAGVI